MDAGADPALHPGAGHPRFAFRLQARRAGTTSSHRLRGANANTAIRVPFYVLLLVPVVIAVLAMDLPRALLAIGVVYALSGPAYWLWRRTRKTPEAAT